MNDPSGVYFLCRGEKVVYVGQSMNVFSRVAAHAARIEGVFDRAFYVPCCRALLNETERYWIRKLQPELNSAFVEKVSATPIAAMSEADAEIDDQEIAVRFAVRRTTVRTAFRAGRLTGRKEGRKYITSRREISAWISRRFRAVTVKEHPGE